MRFCEGPWRLFGHTSGIPFLSREPMFAYPQSINEALPCRGAIESSTHMQPTLQQSAVPRENREENGIDYRHRRDHAIFFAT
jgi:hypothetical protein